MMKRIVTFFTIVFMSITPKLVARNFSTDANLIGDVQCNGKHVPFVNVTLDGTTIGTTTDATGHYQISNIPEGTYTARVSGVGYKSSIQTFTAIPNNTFEIKFVVEEDIFNLEGVVVSADRNQTNRAEAPVIVTSINPKLFEQTQSVNLAEGLCFTPGLRAECNCSNCGFTQLRMNGLDGPYTQILMNSRPVFSGLAGVYGLELIPANMIERLEIVRGGGSALFGGNAIAGTVNIITKEPTRNTYSVDGRYSITGIGGHEDGHESTMPAADAQLNVNASVVTDDAKSGAYLYSMMRDREAHDENGDGFSESVLINNTTFGFSAYHKPGAKSKITLDGYRINEFRRGGNSLHMLPHEADVAEQVEHTVSGGNLAFDYFLNDNYNKITAYVAAQGVQRESYYGAEQDAFGYGSTDDFTSSIGVQYILNSDRFLFASSSTVFGVDNNSNLIDDTKLGALGTENTTLTHQLVNTVGSFVQHDWKSDKLNVSLGLRYDNYLVKDMHGNAEERAQDVSNGVLAPRLGVLLKATPSVRIRGAYAKGYRAPQVFNEDLHIELVNAKRVIHRNDPNLIQETSNTFSLSLNSDYTLGTLINNLLIEGFYTKLNDAFADEYNPIYEENGGWEYLRINSEGATVYGVNIEYNVHFTKIIETSLGFTIQDSKFDEAIQWGEAEESFTTNFLRAPNTYGYLTMNMHFTDRLTSSITTNYTGSMYAAHVGLDANTDNEEELAAIANGDVITGERLEYTEQFYIVDLLVNYDFNLTKETKLRLYAGVKNLFNQTQNKHDSGKFRDAAYIYGPCQPRTINIGVKLSNF